MDEPSQTPPPGSGQDGAGAESPAVPPAHRKEAKLRDRAENVTIREMELEDIPHVFALGEKLFTADRWPNLYRTWDEYEPIGLFTTDGDFCLVAERDDEIVGFVLGALIRKRKSAWTYGYLMWLGVQPEIAGRGVARRLVSTLTDLFIEEGARMMLVDTQAENEKAVRFFRRAGFGDPVEHIYLSKNLTHAPKYLRRRREAEGRTRQPREAKPGPVTGAEDSHE